MVNYTMHVYYQRIFIDSKLFFRTLTPPSYSLGPSTPQSYSLGPSRNTECSNCKHLLGKITVLKATVEMYIGLGKEVWFNGGGRGSVNSGARVSGGGEWWWYCDEWCGGGLCDGDGEWHGCGVYIHAKPGVTGTYTDVVIWLYYPFNGPSKLKLGPFTIKLGKAGEHVSDWEHMRLRVDNFSGCLSKIYLSQHGKGKWVPADDFEYIYGRPVVYAALHDHAHYNAPNIVGPVDEAAKSDRVFDILATPSSYEIVSLDYGDGYVIPPPWSDYKGKWGPAINILWKEEAKIAINLLPCPPYYKIIAMLL
nr:hypothetical protein [Tanacetum cinerariifolium]